MKYPQDCSIEVAHIYKAIEMYTNPAASLVPNHTDKPAVVLNQQIFEWALPTRTRPGVSSTPISWDEFREIIFAYLKNNQAAKSYTLEGLHQQFRKNSQPPLEIDQAYQWMQVIVAVLNSFSKEEHAEEQDLVSLHKFKSEVLALFVQWLVAHTSAEHVIKILARWHEALDRPDTTAFLLSQHRIITVVFRTELVKTPETYYEDAINAGLQICRKINTFDIFAYFAFILADDRPKEHDLQPCAVLSRGNKSISNINKRLIYILLILDSRPSRVGYWRSSIDDECFRTPSCIKPQELVATVIVVAHHYRELPDPTLTWLIRISFLKQKRLLADAILELSGNRALAYLLTVLYQPWMSVILREAIELYPARTFMQCVSELAAGNAEFPLKDIVTSFVQNNPPEKLREWVSANADTLKYLDQTFLTQSHAKLAPLSTWPDVLRTVPWRNNNDTIICNVAPIDTPFVFEFEQTKQVQVGPKKVQELIVTSVTDLLSIINECEAKAPNNSYAGVSKNYRRLSRSLQKLGNNDNKILEWLNERIAYFPKDHWNAFDNSYKQLFAGLIHQPDALALMLWENPRVFSEESNWNSILPKVMERFGQRALPGLIKQIKTKAEFVFKSIIAIDCAEIALYAARILFKTRHHNINNFNTKSWLLKHTNTAIMRLIPDAIGFKDDNRIAAEYTLRWIASHVPNGRAKIDSIAQEYIKAQPQVEYALAQVLNDDHWDVYVVEPQKLPQWCIPEALPALELPDGNILPTEAVVRLLDLLSLLDSTSPNLVRLVDIALNSIRYQIKQSSLSAFLHELFLAQLAAGWTIKKIWILRALGLFRVEESISQLIRLIYRWPNSPLHLDTALHCLDALADIGTDAVLSKLAEIAENCQHKVFQRHVQEKVDKATAMYGLTANERSDRIVPDLGLDNKGGIDLSFGSRQFRIQLDLHLTPSIKNEKGQILKNLPKPGKSDDAELALAAAAHWTNLKKDLKAVTKKQITRLENMLCFQQRVTPSAFWQFFATHKLMRYLTQQLVWGVYPSRNVEARPTLIFRLTDEQLLVDAQDLPVTFDFSKDDQGFIGLVHPLAFPAGQITAWNALFSDYKIGQPILQLTRETYELTDAEKISGKIYRFSGLTVTTSQVRGFLASCGWIAEVEEDYTTTRLIRFVSCNYGQTSPINKASTAILDIAARFFSDTRSHYERGLKLEILSLKLEGNNSTELFEKTDPVMISELLRGPSLLLANPEL